MTNPLILWQSRRHPERYVRIGANRRSIFVAWSAWRYSARLDIRLRSVSVSGPWRYTILSWPFVLRPVSEETRGPWQRFYRVPVLRRRLLESGPVRGIGERGYRRMRYVLFPPPPRFIPDCDRATIAQIVPVKDR
jgi:hypothetical protein